MTQEFLPDNEIIPQSSSNYMKLTELENRFRVLGSAITGNELWIAGKPVRKQKNQPFTPDELANADINKFTGKKKTPQYFWAFPVWNYIQERVQILEITQVTIMRGIEDWLNDSDYGDPKGYDLIVIRDETSDKVEYRVKAKPPKAIDEGIVQLAKDMHINLHALYTGDDPFDFENGTAQIVSDAVAAGI